MKRVIPRINFKQFQQKTIPPSSTIRMKQRKCYRSNKAFNRLQNKTFLNQEIKKGEGYADNR